MTNIAIAPSGDFSPIPSWNGHPVRLDSQGRLSLTDMWKATGGEDRNHPSKWLANKRTQGLVAKLKERVQNSALVLRVIRSGANAGTWAHINLAVAYAEHLDPAFWLWVTDTFLAAGDGRLVPAPSPAAPPAVAEEMTGAIEDMRAEMRAGMKALRDEMGGLARFKEPKRTDKSRHWRIVLEREGGVCPACRKQTVIASLRGPSEGAVIQRYHGSRFREIDQIWPVCRFCFDKLRYEPGYPRRVLSRFQAYQEVVVDWLLENEPDFLLDLRRRRD